MTFIWGPPKFLLGEGLANGIERVGNLHSKGEEGWVLNERKDTLGSLCFEVDLEADQWLFSHWPRILTGAPAPPCMGGIELSLHWGFLSEFRLVTSFVGHKHSRTFATTSREERHAITCRGFNSRGNRAGGLEVESLNEAINRRSEKHLGPILDRPAASAL
ncbi:uncharacterized protein BT62DRAFT_919313 [Guyanagaster necrorhizus]|uniref:Uncharacterized protein n=1 Tax=Guyanagaster necrorhizus TaxID=856835 RepID=A0A9P7VVF7_9AGAR|nr:uncharacterized protein BT62DRAFT_919313 [Guyanagaster necrorhizus MCA 3950]KAG7447430.1 hypothetical protein BT62DRAFT_919313 [Guyanagaster necrorhizus MCA 3950]